MEGIFTLPYSEYAVACELDRLFKKKDGYALFVPLSRQQKGVDLLLANLQTDKTVKIQIKASRAYPHDVKKFGSQFGIWFNNFMDRYKEGDADYYILCGIYPEYHQDGVSSKDVWRNVCLCFNEKEMFAFLKRVKNKKGNKNAFFAFQFDDNKKIHTEKGIPDAEDVSCFLLGKKAAEIQKALGKK